VTVWDHFICFLEREGGSFAFEKKIFVEDGKKPHQGEAITTLMIRIGEFSFNGSYVSPVEAAARSMESYWYWKARRELADAVRRELE